MRYAKTVRRWVVAFAALALLAGGVIPAEARDAAAREGRARRSSPFDLGASSTFLMNFNEWLCGIQQIGEVCTSAVGSSVGGGGFWPSGTANQYIFNSGLQIAGIVGPNGGPWAGDTLSTFFFNASGPGSGAPFAPIYSSSRAEDLAAWPDACYLDNPVFGRVKTLSELDTCVQYWDANPTVHFSDGHPMGILVTQHSMLWSFPSNKDILFFVYRFENATATSEFRQRNPEVPEGGYTINNIYSAFAMDPDVSGAEAGLNFATVVPELDLSAAWHYTFDAPDFVPYAPNFDAAPGFVGVKFLKSPVNTSDTTITVEVGTESRIVDPGEELGLTFFSLFTNGGIMSDAENARQAFRYLSGNLLSSEIADWCPTAPPGMCYVDIQGPDDMRFYQSSGPFTLEPGESAEIVVAYIAGAPVPGTYTKGTVVPVGSVVDTTRAIEQTMGRGYDVTGFPSLFANALTAQAIYDANFVLPSAPRAPNVSVIPGDHQNTITWDATPVDQEDPYCSLALDPENALFDPAFVCADFQGFRVYRKSNPAADYTLIAQFDLNDGITDVVTVLTEVETADSSTLIIEADTARVCVEAGCVDDTGLKFAVVDRGGPFPTPEDGPGLTNGLRYYYAVTSFDINSPFSGPSSLESARVLSEAASGVPRSSAAGNVAAQISAMQLFGDSGTPLDMTGTVTIDAATGVLSGPAPPTNGLTATFEAFAPQLLIPGAMSVKIDSIVTLNGYEDLLQVHVQNNPNALGVSVAYFMTVTTPDGVTQVRQEIASPFGLFGADSIATSLITSAPVSADASRADELGVPLPPLGGSFEASFKYGPDWMASGTEAVSTYRSHVTQPQAGSRWFSGTPVPNPTDSVRNGMLPGVDSIYGVASQYLHAAETRYFVYLLEPHMRAADYEVTWGENGAIASVRDVTHDVAVPFHTNYRSSWGIRNEESGDGILSIGDFWMTSPLAEWFFEVGGEHVDLDQTAVIQPMSTTPPTGFATDVPTSDASGFGLYISGEIFLFETSTLPASGTVWTLRSYNGKISQDSTGAYVYAPAEFRSPAVQGLSAAVTVEAAASSDVAQVDLSNVHTVPDPYYVTNSLETSSVSKTLLFVNLPTEAVVRVYSLSGVLVAALEHDDASGGGTLEWDLRSRNDQYLASGVYFYHVEAPNGDTKVGKFTVVQYAQ